ncbi:hypothetical protein RQP53_00435 [Paucibacter sp. APW11]|uniref:Nitroreductase domain-containing protein n=1 Tax=Roseateles aquae TaxID=3077235 RepID=A0ABU3P591_9BURK|nr:hypothetical protein [Paucibacter sp. APW11]MDT8997735.1 hypothetical protein [Paucibacter sp. APW11]
MDQQGLQQLLRSIIATAALAPSSHNCQPWSVRCLDREQYEAIAPDLPPSGEWTLALLLGIDRRRALAALPALEREMRISVGGFASLLLNLLRLTGFGVRLQWLPKGWQCRQEQEPLLALLLEVPAQPTTSQHPLWQWIARRHTVRGPFLPAARSAPLPADQACLPYHLACSADAATLHWHFVQGGELLERLAGFYRIHAAEDFRHGAAWRETYRHLDFSAATGPRPRSGIHIDRLFGALPDWQRRLYQFALHPTVMRLAGPLGLHRRVGRDFESLVRQSAAIAYLCAEPGIGDERRQQLLAGERITELWLRVTRDGQSLHPLSVALQHPRIEQQLRQLLGCDTAVLFIARVGSPAAPASPPPRYRRAPDSYCSFEFSAQAHQ